MADMISVERVSKGYGAHRVLNDVNFSVSGGVFSLLGRNGAGKTTLVNIMTTLIEPDSGSVRIAGYDTRRERAGVLASIATTGQFSAVDAYLTGRENLQLFARLRGYSGSQARRRADELLEQFDLTGVAGKVAATYSGGTRRRLDLASSLIDPPAVLFLDEPTTGLDPISRRQVWRDISALAADGTTVLLTTQVLEEADALADRIAVLRDGQIVAEGTARELTSKLGSETLVIRGDDDSVVREIATDGTSAGLAAALNGLDPSLRALRVELRRPTLEDAFDVLTLPEQTPPTVHADRSFA